MTITGINHGNRAPEEVIEDQGGDSPLLDIMGPIFLAVGVASLIAGVSMCMYARYPPVRRNLAGRATANREEAEMYNRKGCDDCEDQT